jgi:hypothetical protein
LCSVGFYIKTHIKEVAEIVIKTICEMDDDDDEYSPPGDRGLGDDRYCPEYEDYEHLYDVQHEERDNDPRAEIGAYITHYDDRVNANLGMADAYLLKKARTEMKEVLKRVEVASGRRHPSNLQLFQLFFSDHLVLCFMQWVSDYSSNQNSSGSTRLEKYEVYAFIRKMLLAMYYRTSVSHMMSDSAKEYYKPEININKRRYNFIMSSLNSNKNNRPPVDGTWSPPIMRNEHIIQHFDYFGRNCSRIAFVKGVSAIALDDDLWRARSKTRIAIILPKGLVPFTTQL